MKFWENIFRYPRFFISSMVGLLFILISPIFKIVKNIRNKKVFILLFLSVITISVVLISILNLMINSESY
jgi:hypothetical protein